MINMTREEEIAFNKFTDLFASLIAKHGGEVPKLPEDKRKLLRRIRKYADLICKASDKDIAA